METIRITNSMGQTLTYYMGQFSGIDTTESYWWLSSDKRSFLKLCENE